MLRAKSFPRIRIAMCAALALAASFVGPAAAAPEETTALRARSSVTASPSEEALRARAAIKAGDFSKAHEIVADVLARSRVQNWRHYPFSEFISAVANANDPALEKQLDA